MDVFWKTWTLSWTLNPRFSIILLTAIQLPDQGCPCYGVGNPGVSETSTTNQLAENVNDQQISNFKPNCYWVQTMLL